MPYAAIGTLLSRHAAFFADIAAAFLHYPSLISIFADMPCRYFAMIAPLIRFFAIAAAFHAADVRYAADYFSP